MSLSGSPGWGIVSSLMTGRVTASTTDGLILPKDYSLPSYGSKKLVVYHHAVGEGAHSTTSQALYHNLAAVYPMATSDQNTSLGTNTDTWGNATSIADSTALATYWQGLSPYPLVKSGKVFLAGVSMGGLSSLIYAAHNPTSVAAVFITVPAIDLGGLWNPQTTTTTGTTGNITTPGSWGGTPGPNKLAITSTSGIIPPNATYTTPYPAQATVVCTGGTALIGYTGVDLVNNYLTGCTYISAVSGTPTTINSGAVVAYSRVNAFGPTSGQWTASINSAWGGTYNPATTDAVYGGTTVNGFTFTTQQTARDVFWMGMNHPELFSTFPIIVWYGQQDMTGSYTQIEAWAANINSYCVAHSLPQTVSLVCDPIGTHQGATYNCWYSYGTKVGGSVGTTNTVTYSNMTSVLSTLAALN